LLLIIIIIVIDGATHARQIGHCRVIEYTSILQRAAIQSFVNPLEIYAARDM